MMDIWDVDRVVSNLTSDTIQQDELRKALEEAMDQELKHEMSVDGKKSSTKFIRSTKLTKEIGHNFMVMKILQIATDKGKSQASFRSSPIDMIIVLYCSYPKLVTSKNQKECSNPAIPRHMSDAE